MEKINNTTLKTKFICDSDKKISFNQVKRMPRIIYRVSPQYPIRARTLGIEGKLVVMYDINHAGNVENIRILSAVPIGMFENSVRSAMRCWKFENDTSKENLTIVFKFCLKNIELLNNE